jgi:hypothetical protein
MTSWCADAAASRGPCALVDRLGAAAHVRDHLLGERLRLLGDGLEHLRARGNVLHDALHLGAPQHLLGELVDEPALQHADDEALEPGAHERAVHRPLGQLVVEDRADHAVDVRRGEDLHGDALDHAVLR